MYYHVSFARWWRGGRDGLLQLTSLNTIMTGAPLMITSAGSGYTSAPSTGTVAAGTASSCTATSLMVSTALGGALDLLTAVAPVTPSVGHGRIWFDGAADWPLTVPMGIDQSSNASAMVRMASGTPVGTCTPCYTPYYWGVGGAAPIATWTVYNNTAPAGLNAVVGTSGAVAATASGIYTGTTQVTYCAQVQTGTTFKWGTDPTRTVFTGGCGITMSTSPTMLSNNVSIAFSPATGGTNGQNWTILATPGGSTNEVIQAGVGQTGNVWAVQNNAASTQWWAVSPAGTLAGAPGTQMTLSGSSTGTVTLQPPSSFTNYSLNLHCRINNSVKLAILRSGSRRSCEMAYANWLNSPFARRNSAA